MDSVAINDLSRYDTKRVCIGNSLIYEAYCIMFSRGNWGRRIPTHKAVSPRATLHCVALQQMVPV